MIFKWFLNSKITFKRSSRGHKFILNFFSEPHTEILGGDDMHVDWGSTINLTCVSKFNPAPPVDVIWYHNNKVNIELNPYFVLKVKKGLKYDSTMFSILVKFHDFVSSGDRFRLSTWWC